MQRFRKRSLWSVSVLILFFTLSGCVSFDQIHDNFTYAGYIYEEDASEWISSLFSSFEKREVNVETHVFVDGLSGAVVLGFKVTNEMREELDENETLKGMIEDLEQERLIYDNFLLIPLALSDSKTQEMIDVFNGDA